MAEESAQELQRHCIQSVALHTQSSEQQPEALPLRPCELQVVGLRVDSTLCGLHTVWTPQCGGPVSIALHMPPLQSQIQHVWPTKASISLSDSVMNRPSVRQPQLMVHEFTHSQWPRGGARGTGCRGPWGEGRRPSYEQQHGKKGQMRYDREEDTRASSTLRHRGA